MAAEFCSNIDLSSMQYMNMTATKMGGKSVPVTTKNGSCDWKDRVRFQMSENNRQNLQTAVWNASPPMNATADGATRMSLELTIESPALNEFLCALDKQNIEKAKENAHLWFKNVDPQMVNQMYVPLMRSTPSKPTVKVKVKCGEKYSTDVFVVREENSVIRHTRGVHTDITKGSKCLVVVESSGLWFMNRQFGMSLAIIHSGRRLLHS